MLHVHFQRGTSSFVSRWDDWDDEALAILMFLIGSAGNLAGIPTIYNISYIRQQQQQQTINRNRWNEEAL
jgi:hypothetical protein